MKITKLLKNKPEPLSLEQTYLGARATADLDSWRKAVPTVLEQPVKQGGSESLCPYKFDNRQVKAARAAWLTGFYDEIVDQSELRVRKALGLELINWVPPPEPKREKVQSPKGGPA